jgi:2OG-Fe(II) oxygenase superfamily
MVDIFITLKIIYFIGKIAAQCLSRKEIAVKEYLKIKVRDDAIPPLLYQELLDVSAELEWKFGWSTRSNPAMRYWHHEVGHGSKDNIDDISHQVDRHPSRIFSFYLSWLRAHIVPAEAKLLRFYLDAHTYGTDGWPHTDSERADDLTVVAYLNAEWKPEWGGETVVFDASHDVVAATLPRPNRLLTFPSNLLHAPRPVSKVFSDIRVVLVVKFALGGEPVWHAPAEASLALLKNAGAEHCQHSGRSLLQHLTGTYQLLHQMGARGDVCNAGLFHSIYGTARFAANVSMTRADVRACIGESAERLAWLFCMLERPACWHVAGALLPLTDGRDWLVDGRDITDLKMMERANLREQGILDPHRWAALTGVE